MDTKRVMTDVLEIGYREAGPPDGPVVLLLHGFPDDASAWDDVARVLAGQGRRVIAPYLRGFGPTRFLHDETPRSGQLGALVSDASAFLDALGVGQYVVAGQDWGARVAQGLAVQQPERVDHVVSLGSYGLSWDDGGGFAPPQVLHALWYQWVLMLELGPVLLRYDPDFRDAFCAYLWDAWSPTWPARRQAFATIRASLENPDFADVVLSAYRHGRMETTTDSRYDDLDAALSAGPQVKVPTSVLLGADDGVEQPDTDDPRDARFLPALQQRRLLPGVGHWPHREAPEAVVEILLEQTKIHGASALTDSTP